MSEIIEVITEEEIKKAVLNNGDQVREQFRKHFDTEIDQFCKHLNDVYIEYHGIKIDKYDSKDKEEKRKAYVKSYFYKAIQDLLCGMNLFLSGHMGPSGNLMRHFHESCAVAMALSNKKLSFFEQLIAKPNNFKVSSIFTLIDQNLETFENFNKSGWEKFKEIKNCYHRLSHSTLLSVALFAFMESPDSLVVWGAAFDKGKIEHYKKEITRINSAVVCLKNIIMGIKQDLKL